MQWKKKLMNDYFKHLRKTELIHYIVMQTNDFKNFNKKNYFLSERQLNVVSLR